MKRKHLKKYNSPIFGTPSTFDINGSYTGTPKLNDKNEYPLQDADDL